MTAPVQVGPSPQGGGPVPCMTARETQVLLLAANGNTNRAIGRALGTAEETVKSRIKSILRKLHVDDRAQAVAVGMRLGLIDMNKVVIPRPFDRPWEDV